MKKKKPVVCPECKGSGTSYLDEKGDSDHMNAHTCGSCYGSGLRKEDNEIQAQRVQHIALVIGYNELAKQGQTLGEKVYYRLFRDHHEEQFIKMGGHKMLAREDGICEINVPGHTPHIVFTEQDIELMRQAVAEYDAKKAKARTAVVNRFGDKVTVSGYDPEEPRIRHCGDLKCIACNEQAEHDEKQMKCICGMMDEGVDPLCPKCCPSTWRESARRRGVSDPDPNRTPEQRRVCNAIRERDGLPPFAAPKEPLPEHYGWCEYCGDIITLKTHPQAQWADPHTDEHCFESLKASIEDGTLRRV